MKTRKVLTEKETEGVWNYLWGRKSARQVAKDIGMSHQSVINLVATICREWIQDKKLSSRKAKLLGK